MCEFKKMKNKRNVDVPMVRWKMNKKEIIKNRVNFLYYDQDMTQESIGKVLKISRQTVNKILNSNVEHEKMKLKRIENKKITRKVQFKKNTSPTISIPKDMLEKIGIDPEKNEAEVKVEGTNIVIRKNRKG